MTDLTVITQGPWRIRTSCTDEGQAAISYRHEGESEVVAVETHADLALLRDAINEYLAEVPVR